MLLNILKTPIDLQLSKWSKDLEPTHISKSIYSHKFFQLMKSSPEYNYLQYVLACAMKW
jgi:hypothetical protein